MSPRIIILREEAAAEEGDVIIDARGQPQFFDVVILSGRELKSIVATGAVSAGVPIGVGKYTKKPVAAVIGEKIYIKGMPLTLYAEMGILEKELAEALSKTSHEADILLRKLKEIVVAERRRHKRSQTLSILGQYVAGEINELPPHLADLLGGLDRESIRKLFDRLVEEIY
jgi:hypothetical protein